MLEVTQAQLWQWIGAALWPFARIAACLMIAPTIGAQFVPRRIRLVLAAALAILVAPRLVMPSAIDPLSGLGIKILLVQIAVGLAIGFLMQLVFDAVGLAGQLLGNGMGLSFAFNIDPQRGASTAAVGQFYIVFVTLTFLALDGHLALLKTLLATFDAIPVATHSLSASFFLDIAASGGTLFEGALRIALPGLAALVIANLAFGVVSRAAPSLNILSVGLPAALLFGLSVLVWSLPGVQFGFEHLFDAALQRIGALR